MRYPNRDTQTRDPLTRAIDRANTLLDDEGVPGTYTLDRSETPWAICYRHRETSDVQCYIAPNTRTATLTDTGMRDGTLQYALETIGYTLEEMT